jgi:hypothetical protein
MSYFLLKQYYIHFLSLLELVYSNPNSDYAIGWRPMDQGLIPSISKKFFCSAKCPDWQLFIGCWNTGELSMGVKHLRREAEH